MKKRLIVGITGATGAIYGVELLRTLNSLEDWESHVVLSDAGALNLWHELKMKRKELEKLADVAYHPKDIAATIASGSFLTEGMVIAPCSMKTLAAVAHAHADDLVVARRGRGAEGAPPPGAGAARDAAQPRAPAQHDRGDRDGRRSSCRRCRRSTPCRNRSTTWSRTRVGRILDLFGVHSAKLTRWQGMKGIRAERD